MSEGLVRLPESMRGELKAPMGPVFTDAERLRSAASDGDTEDENPIVAVGDVVTFHLQRAGRIPDVAVVDGLTKRGEVADDVAAGVSAVESEAEVVRVENPAASLTRELVSALRDAIERDEPTIIVVDGEEDLVTLPAILAAPLGASVVYGQPNEGMVLVEVTADAQSEIRSLVERMDGESEALFGILE